MDALCVARAVSGLEAVSATTVASSKSAWVRAPWSLQVAGSLVVVKIGPALGGQGRHDAVLWLWVGSAGRRVVVTLLR